MRIGILIAAALAMIFIMVPTLYFAYPYSDYTWTHFPKTDSNFSFSIEGNLAPINQTLVFTSYNTSAPASDPVVTINGNTSSYAGILDETTAIEIDLLRNGINTVSTDSSSGAYNLVINYTPYWKPVVKRLDIPDLKAGEMAVFAIVVEDNGQDIVSSNIVIGEDKENGIELYNLEFDGHETAVIIDDPGNYVAYVNVFDGVGWSGYYKTSFTTNFVTTHEQLRTDPMSDSEIMESSWGFPSVIGQNDNAIAVFMKKDINAFQMTYLNTKNRLKYYTNTIMSNTDE